MCLPGFTVPVIDDVANLPVDGSLLLAIYKPQYGISASSGSSNVPNAYFDGSGNQLTGIKQIPLFFHGIIGYQALSANSEVKDKIWCNSDANTAHYAVAVTLPEGWAPLDFKVAGVNPIVVGNYPMEGIA